MEALKDRTDIVMLFLCYAISSNPNRSRAELHPSPIQPCVLMHLQEQKPVLDEEQSGYLAGLMFNGVGLASTWVHATPVACAQYMALLTVFTRSQCLHAIPPRTKPYSKKYQSPPDKMN